MMGASRTAGPSYRGGEERSATGAASPGVRRLGAQRTPGRSPLQLSAAQPISGPRSHAQSRERCTRRHRRARPERGEHAHHRCHGLPLDPAREQRSSGRSHASHEDRPGWSRPPARSARQCWPGYLTAGDVRAFKGSTRQSPQAATTLPGVAEIERFAPAGFKRARRAEGPGVTPLIVVPGVRVPPRSERLLEASLCCDTIYVTATAG
jgi:hypothetical protein